MHRVHLTGTGPRMLVLAAAPDWQPHRKGAAHRARGRHRPIVEHAPRCSGGRDGPMLAPPPNLDIAELRAALADGWGIRDPALDYLAVGFGSHHWRATVSDGRRWFVTIDQHRDTGTIAELRRAFATANLLREACGLSFVVAPITDSRGDILRVLGRGAFTVSVTEWIEAPPLGQGTFRSAEHRRSVLRLLGRLHSRTPRVDVAVPLRIDFPIADIDEPWTSGPFGEPTRVLLRSDAQRVAAALARYDELIDLVLAESASWVITHGEPHTANVLRGADGTLHLIDWDTARIAPRERDLWMVIEPATDLQSYLEEAGHVPISASALRLFRMRWDLGELAFYVSRLHAPHESDANTREMWDDLTMYLPVSEDHLTAVL